jgi:translocator protein
MNTRPSTSSATPPLPWIWPIGGALVCVLLGFMSGLFGMGGEDGWYQRLAKPAGTPPSWVFGPVWTALYLMMGWAGGRLLGRRRGRAGAWFAGQFLLNLAWTPVFFGLRAVNPALGIIVGLFIALAITIFHAWRADRTAAVLLLPYLVWVGYASYLNAGIAWLNR